MIPIAKHAVASADAGHRAVVVTLIDAHETLHAGAKLVLREDGEIAGDLGRLHDAAVETARRLIDAPRPKPALLALPGGARAFFDVFAEPPEIIIVGGGHVGQAVAIVATFLGYRIAVIDDRGQFANKQRFPAADTVIAGDIGPAIEGYTTRRNTAIVIVTRGHKYDYEALLAAAKSNAGYVGLMGSRRKVTLIYRQLLADGVSEDRLRDVHAPIGLDIGAVSPEEIAVSILAEITMDRLGGHGGSMRASEQAIAASRRRPVA